MAIDAVPGSRRQVIHNRESVDLQPACLGIKAAIHCNRHQAVFKKILQAAPNCFAFLA